MDYEEARKQESVKEVLNELRSHVELNIFERIVTRYVETTVPARVKAINTGGDIEVVLNVDIDGLDLAEHHDLAAMRVAEKMGSLPRYYLLRAITNWGDPEKDESLLSGFIYLLQRR